MHIDITSYMKYITRHIDIFTHCFIFILHLINQYFFSELSLLQGHGRMCQKWDQYTGIPEKVRDTDTACDCNRKLNSIMLRFLGIILRFLYVFLKPQGDGYGFLSGFSLFSFKAVSCQEISEWALSLTLSYTQLLCYLLNVS